LLAAAVLALSSCAASAQSPLSRSSTVSDKHIERSLKKHALVVFHARGGPDACGKGCSEWIAIEGQFDDAAHLKLNEILANASRRALPVFINSTGGLGQFGMALGQLLRVHRMTIGVGRTLPAGCRTLDEACRQRLQANVANEARLTLAGAHCYSACVYALIGGQVRRIDRSAIVGIHASRISASYVNKPNIGELIARTNGTQLHYVAYMGVDPRVLDMAARTPANRIRRLSASELAQLGIETRAFFETSWLTFFGQDDTNQLIRSWSRQLPSGATQTRNLRIACASGGQFQFIYRREFLPDEASLRTFARLGIGPRAVDLWLENRSTFDETSRGYLAMEDAERALAGGWLTLTETATEGDLERAIVTPLPVGNLPVLLGKLRESCEQKTGRPL
jgi:hypothetical protein